MYFQSTMGHPIYFLSGVGHPIQFLARVGCPIYFLSRMGRPIHFTYGLCYGLSKHTAPRVPIMTHHLDPMIQITLNEYFIRLKYSFIAGFGRVFCVLRSNQDTDWKTDWTAGLSDFFSTTLVLTLFLDFLASEPPKSTYFRFGPLRFWPKKGIPRFCPQLGANWPFFLIQLCSCYVL